MRVLREYAKQTNIQHPAGAFNLLLVFGIAFIYYINGPGAALVGIQSLLGALVPIGLILLALFGIDWIVKRANSK